MVVKEELTKQNVSTGISKFWPQIRYECTVCFHPKTSAWLHLNTPSLTQRRPNHRVEIVIAILMDVPGYLWFTTQYLSSSKPILSSFEPYIYVLIVMSKIAFYDLFLIVTGFFWPSPLAVHYIAESHPNESL